MWVCTCLVAFAVFVSFTESLCENFERNCHEGRGLNVFFSDKRKLFLDQVESLFAKSLNWRKIRRLGLFTPEFTLHHFPLVRKLAIHLPQKIPPLASSI